MSAFLCPDKEAMILLNTIKNILKMNAPPGRVEEILLLIKSDINPQQLFDFNKTIIMPKSLKIIVGSQEDLVSLYITYINPNVFY